MKKRLNVNVIMAWVIIVELFVGVAILVGSCQGQKEESGINTDSLRKVHRELMLKTAEDSLHEFEDGY